MSRLLCGSPWRAKRKRSPFTENCSNARKDTPSLSRNTPDKWSMPRSSTQAKSTRCSVNLAKSPPSVLPDIFLGTASEQPHCLVVAHLELDDPAADVGRHVHKVGLQIGVVGARPLVDPARCKHPGHEHAGQREDAHQDAERLANRQH